MADKHILVAYKKTRYEHFLVNENRDKFDIARNREQVSVEALKQSHETHSESIEAVREVLADLDVSFDCMYRSEVQDPDNYDLVVALGGDGTVLVLSHWIRETPVLAVNSVPDSSVGYFCSGPVSEFRANLEKTLEGEWKPFELQRFDIEINDRKCKTPILNDILICHDNPAAVSEYSLAVDGGPHETQKSSGIWVSTPAGSTAAIRSAGGYVLPLESNFFQYYVREPYPIPGHSYRYLKGIRAMSNSFEVVSKMNAGCVYIDGPHIRHEFCFGDRLRVLNETPPLKIYGLNKNRRIQ